MPKDYWAKGFDPEYDDKMELFHGFLYSAHNGSMDVEGYIHSEYGQELGRRMRRRFRIEDEPLGEESVRYYESIGLRKEYFETEDYYTRWFLMTPLEMYTEAGAGKKYPLVFWHHGGGNPIESSECVSGICETAGREGFMVAMLQNTNWRNVERVLDIIGEKYPLDKERVYCAGFSQGGYQTHSAYMRMPERFAGAATSGSEIYRPYDNQDVPYSKEDLERVRNAQVPLIQVVGACEPSCFVPLNDWSPRRTPQAGIMPGSPDTIRRLELRSLENASIFSKGIAVRCSARACARTFAD